VLQNTCTEIAASIDGATKRSRPKRGTASLYSDTDELLKVNGYCVPAVQLITVTRANDYQPFAYL
jgi:hypothetical protein